MWIRVFVKKWKLLGYHLEDLRVPLVVSLTQAGNYCFKQLSFFSTNSCPLMSFLDPSFASRSTWKRASSLASLVATDEISFHNSRNTDVQPAITQHSYARRTRLGENINNSTALFFSGGLPAVKIRKIVTRVSAAVERLLYKRLQGQQDGRQWKSIAHNLQSFLYNLNINFDNLATGGSLTGAILSCHVELSKCSATKTINHSLSQQRDVAC